MTKTTKKTSKKKTTSKSENAAIATKAMLLDEAKNLIASHDILNGKTYAFVRRNNVLTFCVESAILPGDLRILQIPGSKILKGLEEYQWNTYIDAICYIFAGAIEEMPEAGKTE